MISRIARIKLPPDVKGHSLLDFLSGRFSYLNRAGWQEAIEEGRITIDGMPATTETPLAWNQILEYTPPERPEPEVNRNARLVFQSEDFLVIDKPANLPCHPAGCFFNSTLWAVLKEGEIPGLAPLDSIHFISRLDRETSGLVLLAKTAEFHTRAMKILHTDSVEKRYLILVHGNFPDFLEARGFLFHDPKEPVEKKRSFSFQHPGPTATKTETACTSFICQVRTHDLSLVEAILHTGRFHQIRATMSSLGFPVVGDKIYGPDSSIYLRFSQKSMTEADRQSLLIPRQALHAWKLRFNGQDFYSPLPEELQITPEIRQWARSQSSLPVSAP